MLRVEPHTLGSRIKYLLRCSNDSYPDILTDVQGSADLFVNKDEDFHNLNKYPGDFDILEIQAYDEQIVIRGEAISNPEYWPAGYPVEQFGGGHSWRAADIVLPVDVSDDELGRLLLRVWAAKQYLPTPHPQEFTAFWQRIAD
jgi:hypothetical protein